MNEIKNRKATEKISKSKSQFFEKNSKIDKPLARLATKKKEREKKRKKKHITNIRNERRISLLFLCTLKISKDMSNSKPTI